MPDVTVPFRNLKTASAAEGFFAVAHQTSQDYLMATLLYHLAQNGNASVSPFDEAVLKVARSGPVRIVSPYIGVAYLQRIISVTPQWRLISDVQEWLGALSVQARPRAWQFIRENLELIHHCPALHAKAVISDCLAMMGSANLTQHGILGRTEMGILLDDPRLVAEMSSWFDDLWRETNPLIADEASAYVQWLDEEASHAPSRRQRFALSSGSRKVRARLVKIEVAEQSSSEGDQEHLDLGLIAQAMIAQDQKHYESIESALDAAIDKLAEQGPFTLGQLVAKTRKGFPTTNLREIYFLLVQHCANHVRSVFVETTRNRLVLLNGHFAQSNKEILGPALVPFDNFLTVLIGKLSFTMPARLPTEDQLERETGIGGRDQLILIAELLDCGLLVLDDRPGELPCYSLDYLFDEWNGRFNLFPKAHAAWIGKQRQRMPTSVTKESDDDPDDASVDDYRILRGDQLPEADGDEGIANEGFDFGSLEKWLRESRKVTKRPNSSDKSFVQKTVPAPILNDVLPTAAHERSHANDDQTKYRRKEVDVFFVKLIRAVARGETFIAPDWGQLVEYIASETLTPEPVVAEALDPASRHPKVFIVIVSDGWNRLRINPMLSWEMLLRYPKTRAICESVLGSQ